MSVMESIKTRINAMDDGFQHPACLCCIFLKFSHADDYTGVGRQTRRDAPYGRPLKTQFD